MTVRIANTGWPGCDSRIRKKTTVSRGVCACWLESGAQGRFPFGELDEVFIAAGKVAEDVLSVSGDGRSARFLRLRTLEGRHRVPYGINLCSDAGSTARGGASWLLGSRGPAGCAETTEDHPETTQPAGLPAKEPRNTRAGPRGLGSRRPRVSRVPRRGTSRARRVLDHPQAC